MGLGAEAHRFRRPQRRVPSARVATNSLFFTAVVAGSLPDPPLDRVVRRRVVGGTDPSLHIYDVSVDHCMKTSLELQLVFTAHLILVWVAMSLIP